MMFIIDIRARVLTLRVMILNVSLWDILGNLNGYN